MINFDFIVRNELGSLILKNRSEESIYDIIVNAYKENPYKTIVTCGKLQVIYAHEQYLNKHYAYISEEAPYTK